MITDKQRQRLLNVINRMPTNPPAPRLSIQEMDELRALIKDGRESDAWSELRYKSDMANSNALELVMSKSRKLASHNMERKESELRMDAIKQTSNVDAALTAKVKADKNPSGLENPWDIANTNDPKPEQNWYIAARYFARQLVKDDSTLIIKRNKLAEKTAASLEGVGILKRGGKLPIAATTVLKALVKVTLS